MAAERVGLPESQELVELRERVDQLQTALESRVVVEQAKGVLAERFHFAIDEAFLLLRYSARSSRRNIHELAREVVESRSTPSAVTIALARQQRWRAAGQRERAEAHRARAVEERARIEQFTAQLRDRGQRKRPS